jgi:lipoprotein
MKRRSALFTLAAALLIGGASTMLTGCADDDYWPYNPPPGWGANYFYDSRLEGSWELTQDNSAPVGSYDTNYMDFFGGGHGRYYYYYNNRPASEEMAYFCQKSGSQTSNYQINIQYEDGSASTMAYWFTDSDDTLWLQWKTNSGQTVTYLYTRIKGAPW